MAVIENVVYTLAFFVFVVGGMLYLVWRSTKSDVHSPSVGDPEEPSE